MPREVTSQADQHAQSPHIGEHDIAEPEANPFHDEEVFDHDPDPSYTTSRGEKRVWSDQHGRWR